jgi:hypothetical protein
MRNLTCKARCFALLMFLCFADGAFGGPVLRMLTVSAVVAMPEPSLPLELGAHSRGLRCSGVLVQKGWVLRESLIRGPQIPNRPCRLGLSLRRKYGFADRRGNTPKRPLVGTVIAATGA